MIFNPYYYDYIIINLLDFHIIFLNPNVFLHPYEYLRNLRFCKCIVLDVYCNV